MEKTFSASDIEIAFREGHKRGFEKADRTSQSQAFSCEDDWREYQSEHLPIDDPITAKTDALIAHASRLARQMGAEFVVNDAWRAAMEKRERVRQRLDRWIREDDDSRYYGGPTIPPTSLTAAEIKEARDALIEKPVAAEVIELLTRLFKILDTIEVSDNDCEFRPTYITSCRTQHVVELEKIMPRLKTIVRHLTDAARPISPAACDNEVCLRKRYNEDRDTCGCAECRANLSDLSVPPPARDGDTAREAPLPDRNALCEACGMPLYTCDCAPASGGERAVTTADAVAAIEAVRRPLGYGHHTSWKLPHPAWSDEQIETVRLILASQNSAPAEPVNEGWRPIDENMPRDGTIILRPHVNWGAMAVRHKRPDQSEAFLRGFSWMSADYSALWPEEAFLPFWMPRPEVHP